MSEPKIAVFDACVLYSAPLRDLAEDHLLTLEQQELAQTVERLRELVEFL